MPTEAGTSKELVTLGRNLAYSDVFEAMDNLITYRIDSSRKQAPLKLLIQLSRALTMDGIDLGAQKAVKNAVLSKMDDEILRIKESGDYDTRGASITGFALGTLIFDYGDNAYSFDEETQTMTMSEFDISRHFEQAGKLLGEGLHKEYWIRHSTRDHIDVKKKSSFLQMIQMQWKGLMIMLRKNLYHCTKTTRDPLLDLARHERMSMKD